MAKSPKAEPVEEEVAEVTAKKPAGKKKLIIIVIAASVMLLGGGGAWFTLKGKPSPEGEALAKPVKKEVKHADKGVAPIFLPLDPFVVNLHSPAAQGNDQFLQTDMTIRLAGLDVVDEVKAHMPEVRNRILMLLSSKTSQELLTAEGKVKLAESVRVEITAIVDPESIKPPEAPKVKKDAPEAAKPDDAKEEAKEEAPAEAEEAQSPEDYKVKSVLFTSFIIQ